MRRLPVAMAVSVLLGGVAVVLGLVISYHQDTAAAATVAGVAVAQFFVALIVREVATLVAGRRAAPPVEAVPSG